MDRWWTGRPESHEEAEGALEPSRGPSGSPCGASPWPGVGPRRQRTRREQLRLQRQGVAPMRNLTAFADHRHFGGEGRVCPGGEGPSEGAPGSPGPSASSSWFGACGAGHRNLILDSGRPGIPESPHCIPYLP